MAVASIEEVVLLRYSSDVSIIERKIFTVVSLNTYINIYNVYQASTCTAATPAAGSRQLTGEDDGLQLVTLVDFCWGLATVPLSFL